MDWITVLEKEQLLIRVDKKKNVSMEVNSGGLTPKYVTLHLGKTDLDELTDALQALQRVLNTE